MPHFLCDKFQLQICTTAINYYSFTELKTIQAFCCLYTIWPVTVSFPIHNFASPSWWKPTIFRLRFQFNVRLFNSRVKSMAAICHQMLFPFQTYLPSFSIFHFEKIGHIFFRLRSVCMNLDWNSLCIGNRVALI